LARILVDIRSFY